MADDMADARAWAGPAHRLRDLTRPGRWVAGGLAAALLLAPVLAVLHFAPDWAPAGDVALMSIRSYDALTSRLPLLGQPSTSGLYGGFERHTFHPGPLQFYLSAPLVRVAGAAVGMATIAVAVNAASTLVAAWVAFRQLGPRGGAVAAVTLGLVTFTAGAASLVNPISSNMARYPLLATAVLVWGLACGDLRLLPLAVAAVSFAGQAHLSVGPSVAVLAATGLACVATHLARGGAFAGPAARRATWRWVGGSAALGVALWLPVLYQQVHGDPGNLTALAAFASDGDRPGLGPASAARQVAHVLGLPPLLGRTGLRGGDLLAPVGAVTWASAAAVLAVLAVAGVRWRRHRPRRAAAVAMVGVLVVCGLLSGTNVPDSLESTRLSFYHWAWPLAFFATLGLAGVAASAGRRLLAARGLAVPPRLAPAAAVLAVVAVALPAAVNPALDRPSSELMRSGTPHPRWVYTSLVDQALDGGLADVEGDVVVTRSGGPVFDGTVEALALQLMERDVDVAFRHSQRYYVADEHLAEPDEVGAVLEVVTERPGVRPPPSSGTVVGRVDLDAGFDDAAWEEVVTAYERADAVEPGPEMAAWLEDLEADDRRVAEASLDDLLDEPAVALYDADVLDRLAEMPPATPAVPADAYRRARDGMPAGEAGALTPVGLTVRLVVGEEARDLLFPDG